ncbi:hypothetical protein ElyMa_005735600 [Elysia marginata]|uniref:Uncharacterized protein n=1 Tax=Elysia marginata TaxID=1093978 RepID=A0AAV4FLM3_9GAST|nr:hypothetical protein ElyMa_005735600 [Elysia marginata]
MAGSRSSMGRGNDIWGEHRKAPPSKVNFFIDMLPDWLKTTPLSVPLHAQLTTKLASLRQLYTRNRACVYPMYSSVCLGTVVLSAGYLL